MLECRAASILQFALGRVGGILEAKKIAGMAEASYAQIAPHLYCGPVEGAANIQLAASLPNFLILESIENWGGIHAELLKSPIRWEEGYIIPSKEPGLGIELDEKVAAALSASSLQLSLENQKLADARAAYVKALKARGETGDDVVGFVFAINGRVNSAEIYPSNGLFRKMWPKLLDASATEAIGEKSAKAEPAPDPASVQAFLAAAEKGAATESRLDERLVREARDGPVEVVVAVEPGPDEDQHRHHACDDAADAPRSAAHRRILGNRTASQPDGGSAPPRLRSQPRAS